MFSPKTISAVIGAVVATAVFAAAQGSLLYTPLTTEVSNQDPAVAALVRVTPEEVQYVHPMPLMPYTSKAFAPQTGYGELVGDHDSDGTYYEGTLFRNIDAVLDPVSRAGFMVTNMRNLFFSTSINVNHALGVGAGWPLRPGDVARILPGGQVERFLSQWQVQTAFGILGPAGVNVDAVAFDPNPQLGGIYLSFENMQTLGSGITVQDGAVLFIPFGAVGWGTSLYDGALVAVTVAANSGQIVWPEPQMDLFTATANLGDAFGAVCNAVGDTDGLSLDPTGGYIAGTPWHHLWFSGRNLTGGAVLTTQLGGSIPALNGVPLGSLFPAPTTGLQVGLITPNGVRSLDGLAWVEGMLCHFAGDSPTPMGAPTATFEFGGTQNPTFLIFTGWLDMLGPADPSLPIANPCFPEVWWSPPFTMNVPINPATGCGSVSLPLPMLPGVHAVGQGLTVGPTGAFWLSTPIVVDL